MSMEWLRDTSSTLAPPSWLCRRDWHPSSPGPSAYSGESSEFFLTAHLLLGLLLTSTMFQLFQFASSQGVDIHLPWASLLLICCGKTLLQLYNSMRGKKCIKKTIFMINKHVFDHFKTLYLFNYQNSL